MARPRTPPAKAKATGAALKNPARHEGRKPTKGAMLGAPPAWMTDKAQREAWALFKAELPWLKESHRALMEIAAMLRGAIIANKGPIALQPMQELRRILGQLGATPADESKVTLPDGDEDDPDDAFFRQPAAGSKPN